MELNNVIFSLRTVAGYTQERLADMLGVSSAAVSKWECGIAFPDITLLPKIAGVFNVSIDYLLGYDKTCQKTISEVVAEASKLRREQKLSEAEHLLEQTLARYPNNLQLTFELARHRFSNASRKSKAERDILFSESKKGFLTVAVHDDNKAHRDWSFHYLATISMIDGDYEKAIEYNSKILPTKGLFPRITDAVIQMNRSCDETSFEALNDGIITSIYEFTMLLPWITAYYMEKGEYDAVIKENLRAVKVYENFTEYGWIIKALEECYEILALAYANKEDNNHCLDCLERASANAILYDSQTERKAFSVTDDFTDIEMEDSVSSDRKALLETLLSSEREIYAPIQKTERFQMILQKLSE